MNISNRLLFIIIILIILYGYFHLLRNQKTTKEPFVSKIQNNIAFDKCYVINLKETEEGQRRWKIFLKQPILATYINRFPGIYGLQYNYTKEIQEGIINPKWDFGSWHHNSPKFIDMDPGEIGCILSHRKVWAQVVKEKLPCTLILEDDAISLKRDFINIIINLKTYLPNDWDILLLGFWLHMGDNGIKINKYIHSVGNFCLLHSYLISQQGARKLLKLGVIDKPLDTWLSVNSNRVNIYRHNIIRKNTQYPTSSLIRQHRKEKQIKNTNNW